jgi:hypothetical protein
VVERSNACSDGATCSNLVEIEGTVKILQLNNSIVTYPPLEFKIKNRYDTSAICTNTPD